MSRRVSRRRRRIGAISMDGCGTVRVKGTQILSHNFTNENENENISSCILLVD